MDILCNLLNSKRPLHFCHSTKVILRSKRGRVDDFPFFDCTSPFYFLNWMSLYFFHILLNTAILCLFLLYFDLVVTGRRAFFLSYPLYLFPYSLLSSYHSVSLSHFILAVPMRECLEKRSYVSYTFPITILNCTCFFLTAQRQVHKRRSRRDSLVGWWLGNFLLFFIIISK